MSAEVTHLPVERRALVDIVEPGPRPVQARKRDVVDPEAEH